VPHKATGCPCRILSRCHAALRHGRDVHAQHIALPGMTNWLTRLRTCTVTQHGHTACEGSTSMFQVRRALSGRAGRCKCMMLLCASPARVCTQQGLHRASGTRHHGRRRILHARRAWSAVPALPVAQAQHSGRPCLLLNTCRYFSTSVTDIRAHTLVALARETSGTPVSPPQANCPAGNKHPCSQNMPYTAGSTRRLARAVRRILRTAPTRCTAGRQRLMSASAQAAGLSSRAAHPCPETISAEKDYQIN